MSSSDCFTKLRYSNFEEVTLLVLKYIEYEEQH